MALTVSGTVGAAAKVAVTSCGPSIITTHVPVPLHAPPQPVKMEPFVGTALSVTNVGGTVAR
jgi:hypothetical protein